MGMVGSLLRRYAVALFEEEIRPAAARVSSARRRRGTRLGAAAYRYVLAENWREAALTFTEQAANNMEFGDDEGELSAASALLRSAKFYGQIEEKDEGEIAASKHALKKAIALFVKQNDLEMAATGCVNLAEFYLEHEKLQSAADSYEEAADYCGANPRRNHHLRFKANLIRFTLDHQEMICSDEFPPLGDYRTRFNKYIKSSDPDWRAQLRDLMASTNATPSVLLQRAYIFCHAVPGLSSTAAAAAAASCTNG